jgi:hypothetical protein
MSEDERGREAAPSAGGEPLGRKAASDPDAESQRDPGNPPGGDAPPDRPRKSVKEQVERMEGEGGPPSPSRPGRPRGE